LVFRSLYTFIASFALWGASALAALAADPFTVSAVPVDATGQTAIEAQTIAISDGQLRAGQALIERLTLGGSGSVTLDTPTIAKLIRALEISNEKRSGNRYLGDITVAFNAKLGLFTCFNPREKSHILARKCDRDYRGTNPVKRPRGFSSSGTELRGQSNSYCRDGRKRLQC